MLVTTTDVGGQNFKDNTVLALAVAKCQFRIRDRFYSNFSWAFVDNTTVGFFVGHRVSLLRLFIVVAFLDQTKSILSG